MAHDTIYRFAEQESEHAARLGQWLRWTQVRRRVLLLKLDGLTPAQVRQRMGKSIYPADLVFADAQALLRLLDVERSQRPGEFVLYPTLEAAGAEGCAACWPPRAPGAEGWRNGYGGDRHEWSSCPLGLPAAPRCASHPVGAASRSPEAAGCPGANAEQAVGAGASGHSHAQGQSPDPAGAKFLERGSLRPDGCAFTRGCPAAARPEPTRQWPPHLVLVKGTGQHEEDCNCGVANRGVTPDNG